MKPISVISGDIHYSLATLQVADAAVRQAIAKANELNVPFIANGDTHDTKANLRAECVNAMIETFKLATVRPIVNIGNHCKINAKSADHALNFLNPYATVINSPTYIKQIDSYVIPYYDDVSELKKYLGTLPTGTRLIMHQGLNGSLAGEYIKDHSALTTEDLKDFRVILSHYHTRQDIQCGSTRPNMVGIASYVGSPYTLNYAEANDPPKGYQILMDDGSLKFVPTNLRRHVKLDVEQGTDINALLRRYNPDDLIWLRLHGPRESFIDFDANKLARPCRIEFVYTAQEISQTSTPDLSTVDQLDQIIDGKTNEASSARIKLLWRDL